MDYNRQRHIRELNRKFYKKETNDPSEYLETAKKAVGIFDRYTYERPEGIYWEATIEDEAFPRFFPKVTLYPKGEKPDEELDFSLYSGQTGICFALLQLYLATHDEAYLKKAEEGLQLFRKKWKSLETFHSVTIRTAKYGYFYGIAGAASVLLAFYKVTKKPEDKELLIEIIDYLDSIRQEAGDGIYWIDGTGLSVDGGTALFLLEAGKELGYQKATEDAVRAGKHLLTHRIETEYGITYDNKPMVGQNIPNFVYGSSGTGYVLTRLYEETGEQVFLDAAKEIGAYLQKIAVPQEKGILIPYKLDTDKTEFYLNFCHGPGGTSRLFYQLYKITGEKAYKDFIFSLSEAVIDHHVTRIQSETIWNNVSYCCGAAGLLHYFIQLYTIEPDQKYADLAKECGDVLLGEADYDGDLPYWPLAFMRMTPDLMSIKAGYYDGSAGILASLAELYLFQSGKYEWLRLPDDPYPDKIEA